MHCGGTRLMAGLLALTLAGCGGMQHAMEHYSGITPVEVAMADDSYRVFDKPSDNRIMVTSSLGSAANQGALKGLTLGIADTTPPMMRFRAAAEHYLKDRGRASCRITSGVLLVQPQYEFRYAC